MKRYPQLRNEAAVMLLLFALGSHSAGQHKPKTQPRSSAGNASTLPSSKSVTSTKAFVVDDRLSTLRRGPGLQSEVIHRLRLGHRVYIIGYAKPKAEPRFCRVAVTRRTRGWILESALAMQG